MTATILSVARLCLVAGVMLLSANLACATEPPALVKQTHTFKKVGELKIQADVYRPDDSTVRPALVAYWGYGDVDGDWYTKPSEFYRKQVPLIDKADADKGVGAKPTTGSEDGIDMKARGRFYLYLRQNGLWTKEVTGFDPATEKA